MAFTNLQRVLSQLRQWGRAHYDGAAHAQVDAAELVLQRAKFYTPVDTGALKASGRVEVELRELRRSGVRIVFDAPYSTYVHERLDVHHAPPTRAKYLQTAVDEMGRQMTVMIGEGAVAAARRRAR